MSEDRGDNGHALPSPLRATPAKNIRRLQQRKSFSPYARTSPRTPIRRAEGAGESSLVAARSQPTSPQSPGMRAISSIIGLLSPFSSWQAKNSAAFGEPREANEADETQEHDGLEEGEVTEELETTETMDETGNDSQDIGQDSIYPPIPDPPSISEFGSSSPYRDERQATQGVPQTSLSVPAFSAPRHSTPSKMGFAAVAAAASPSRQVFPPSASAFTFGSHARATASGSSGPVLPAYPRQTAKLSSPLAKNYDLLARFFAEKAEQEARGEVTSSSASMLDGDVEGDAVGLTEIEVAGCMRLIEESLAQGRESDLRSLRDDALARTGLDPSTPRYFGDTHYSRGAMSRSPSLPLGAAAGEMSGTFGRQSRPSSSFLAPSYTRSHDDKINRSLATSFGNSSFAANKRRHRPLYLGPGQGITASTSILKRKQQIQEQRKAMIERTLPNHRPSAPSNWQQDKVDDEDRDASGSNVKRRRLQEEENSTQSGSLLSSQSMPSSISTAAATSKPTVAPPNALTSRKVTQADPPQVAPARTATADALLSILSTSPSIPVRRHVPGTTLAAEDSGSTAKPDVVNPYQTRSRQSKWKSAASSSHSLAAKEKERLKEEREKRQRVLQESKKPKESTLEMLERTAPTSAGKRASRRNQVPVDNQNANAQAAEVKRNEDERRHAEEAEEERKREGQKEETEQRKKLAQEDEERRRKEVAEEERRKKTDEVKKRMDKLTSQQNNSASTSTAPSTDASTTSSSASSAPRKSFTFGSSSFAPKKPSPLSQADNIVPDSPSSSSEASERNANKPFSFSSPSSKWAEPSAKDIDSVKVQSQPNPFLPIAQDIDVPVGVARLQKGPGDARQQALNTASSSLPKFDFALDVVLSPSCTGKDDEARHLAKAKQIPQLPSFKLYDESGTKGSELTVSSSLATTTPTSATSIPSFSFHKAAAEPVSQEDGATATAQAESSDAKSSEASVSALLAGTGEGEENEECLHEVRSKVWNLKDGKWLDLGIGLFKIKKDKGDGKKRILVRNEGNGKVMVNFRLMESFKPLKDKNVVSFLGFDSEGKPTNYRCKVKTNDNADDLARALQREAGAA